MKLRTPFNRPRKRSWISRSALAVALTSAAAIPAPDAFAGDDDSALLVFHAKPAAPVETHDDLAAQVAVPAEEPVLSTEAEPAPVVVAAAVPQPVEPEAQPELDPQLEPEPEPEPVRPAPVASKPAPSTALDLSLPPTAAGASVYRSEVSDQAIAAAGLGLSSLDYIRGMVMTALGISPEMKQAEASLGAARSDVDQAKGARWPQVQVGLNSPTYRTKKYDGEGDGSGTSVQMVTPIYDFGTISNTIDSRNKTANAQEQAMEQARVTVAYNTVASLLELSHQQEALAISDQYVARMRELVNMLSQIAEVDPGRRSEVVQARSRLLQAETSRANVQAKLQQVKTSLAKLVGEDVEVPSSVKWEWNPMELDQALSTMQDSPTLLQARWEMDAARASAESVKSSRFPTINWVVGRNTGNDVFSNDEPWSTGLSLQWNAFQGGSATAAQRAAYQRADAAEQRMETSRREAEYQIRNLAQQRDLAASRIAEYSSLMSEADSVRKMFYEQWYHLGKRTLLDVLIAENEYYTDQIQAIDNFYLSKSADLQIRSASSGLLSWLSVAGERPAQQL